MTDPAEIRVEMRRMLDAWHRGVDVGLVDYLTRNADVLLADPAPVGLTEDEREALEMCRASFTPADDFVCGTYVQTVVAIIDRLSAAPVDDRERVPEGWRVQMVGNDIDGWLPRLVPVSPSVDPEEKP